MAVIDSFRGILTVFVEYSTTAEDAQDLLKDLQNFHLKFTSNASGFVSNNYHLSLDQKTIYNYAQWKSEEAFDSFWTDQKVVKAAENFLSAQANITKTKVVLAT